MNNEAYIRSLEERIEILEIVVNSILRFDFPVNNEGGMYRNFFSLYCCMRYDPEKDEDVKNAIDQLEYTIIKRDKE